MWGCTFALLMLSLPLCNSFKLAARTGFSKQIPRCWPSRQFAAFASASDQQTALTLREFLVSVAKAPIVPKKLDTLLTVLKMDPTLELMDPSDRAGLNPFLVPVARTKGSTSADGLLCYIRWPTQKDDMELQLVRTGAAGMTLEALKTNDFLVRKACELDFESSPDAQKVIDLVNADEEAPLYTAGDYMAFLKSGKFPTITVAERRVVLDKFLLTKVGHFPDCYVRIADKFFEDKNEISALVTCERALSVFYGWGFPCFKHSQMLLRCTDREKEARDSAKAAMGQPVWTLSASKDDIEKCAVTAGFTGMDILAAMHLFRANDPREKDIAEGLSPIQVMLDQAAHLMDAVGYGEGSWESSRETLATKYRESGYPEMADFIGAVNR